jgi:hypothetical protein
MNRQVVPSMILSVLIVGFFGVLLFERDPPHAGARTRRVAAKKKTVATNSPAAAAVEERETPAHVTNPPVNPKPERAQVAAEPSISDGRVISRVGASDAPSQAAPKSISTAQPSEPSKPPAAAVSQKPSAAADQDVTRAVDTDGGQHPATASHSPARTAQPEPRSAFTVVQRGETLRDVAVRVYGSADPLDSLWRANRDLLPRKDSPLIAGSVLRTPQE